MGTREVLFRLVRAVGDFIRKAVKPSKKDVTINTTMNVSRGDINIMNINVFIPPYLPCWIECPEETEGSPGRERRYQKRGRRK